MFLPQNTSATRAYAVVSRGAETRKELFAQRTTLLATSVCLFNKAGESAAFDFNEVVTFPRVYVVVVAVVAEEEGSCVSLSQRIATQGCLSLSSARTPTHVFPPPLVVSCFITKV